MAKSTNKKRKSAHTRPAGYTAARAKHWCVSVRVMQQWLKRNVPVDDDAAMVQWWARLSPASQNKLSAPFRRRITEVRLALERLADDDNPLPGDPDWAAFKSAEAEQTVPGDKTALADLKRQFQFYLFKQRACTSRNDAAGASDCTRQLTALGGIIHDMELRDQKLGRDLGDLVPRSTLEAAARHIAYHLLRCADSTLAAITAALTRRDPSGAPLLAEEIAVLIEPILLDRHILQPITLAANGNNPAAPPDWLVKALHAGLADVLETTP